MDDVFLVDTHQILKSLSGPNTHRRSIYLYEFVSLLQAVPQFPLLSLSVLSVVLPDSIGLLLLLLFLPQLLPSVLELCCQRGHRLTVTLLLILVKRQKESLERLRFVVAVLCVCVCCLSALQGLSGQCLQVLKPAPSWWFGGSLSPHSTLCYVGDLLFCIV